MWVIFRANFGKYSKHGTYGYILDVFQLGSYNPIFHSRFVNNISISDMVPPDSYYVPGSYYVSLNIRLFKWRIMHGGDPTSMSYQPTG